MPPKKRLSKRSKKGRSYKSSKKGRSSKRSKIRSNRVNKGGGPNKQYDLDYVYNEEITKNGNKLTPRVLDLKRQQREYHDREDKKVAEQEKIWHEGRISNRAYDLADGRGVIPTDLSPSDMIIFQKNFQEAQQMERNFREKNERWDRERANELKRAARDKAEEEKRERERDRAHLATRNEVNTPINGCGDIFRDKMHGRKDWRYSWCKRHYPELYTRTTGKKRFDWLKRRLSKHFRESERARIMNSSRHSP